MEVLSGIAILIAAVFVSFKISKCIEHYYILSYFDEENIRKRLDNKTHKYLKELELVDWQNELERREAIAYIILNEQNFDVNLAKTRGIIKM